MHETSPFYTKKENNHTNTLRICSLVLTDQNIDPGTMQRSSNTVKQYVLIKDCDEEDTNKASDKTKPKYKIVSHS